MNKSSFVSSFIKQQTPVAIRFCRASFDFSEVAPLGLLSRFKALFRLEAKLQEVLAFQQLLEDNLFLATRFVDVGSEESFRAFIASCHSVMDQASRSRLSYVPSATWNIQFVLDTVKK